MLKKVQQHFILKISTTNNQQLRNFNVSFLRNSLSHYDYKKLHVFTLKVKRCEPQLVEFPQIHEITRRDKIGMNVSVLTIPRRIKMQSLIIADNS